jgi:uncharacterized protein YndB with AHSA1/START domain
MPQLVFDLERTVLIRANPEAVFRFFTDSARWASWWGAGSTIDPFPGGKVYIRHPNGVETVGEVMEVCEPEKIVFTYGYASGKPIGPGQSRVTIQLEAAEEGTRLHLRHEFVESAARDEHVPGWRFQLSLFSNTVANEVYADTAPTIDAWFAAWRIADVQEREQALAKIAAPDISFRDRYSLLDARADLTAHIGAALKFMPGITLQRKGSGNVRQCQGTVLADWSALGRDGIEQMSGTGVFCFRPDGRIGSVIIFSNM